MMPWSGARLGPDHLRAAFVASTIAWSLMLVLAPWLATTTDASAWTTAVVAAVYGAGSLVCHQLPARSFHVWTTQMPVCARCTGIYAGGMVAAVSAAAVRPRGVSTPLARVALAAAAMPSLATLVYEWTTGVAPGNPIRFAAGAPLGASVAWLLVAASRNQVN
jgi:uncharacterized membrane protein